MTTKYRLVGRKRSARKFVFRLSMIIFKKLSKYYERVTPQRRIDTNLKVKY